MSRVDFFDASIEIGNVAPETRLMGEGVVTDTVVLKMLTMQEVFPGSYPTADSGVRDVMCCVSCKKENKK